MQKHTRRRQPWDWRGQIIQLLLIALVCVISGGIAYLSAVITALLVSGGPPPVPAGWQNAVVLVVALAVLCSLMFVGTVRIGRYLRKNRGRML